MKKDCRALHLSPVDKDSLSAYYFIANIAQLLDFNIFLFYLFPQFAKKAKMPVTLP